MRPTALLPCFPGTNCHHDLAEGFQKAGADPKIVWLKSATRPKLYEADLIGWSGGFAHGDYFGTARVAAVELLNRLRDELLEALERRIPMIGICNGHQILTATGLLTGRTVGSANVVMDLNLSSNFEHRNNATLLVHKATDCLWTRHVLSEKLVMPSAHGEGRPVLAHHGDPPNIAFTYGTYEGTTESPISPNGSRVAGFCVDT